MVRQLLALLVYAVIAMRCPAPAWAETASPPQAQIEAPMTQVQQLDGLFSALHTLKSAEKAHQVELLIQQLWMQSDSDTANLFISWGTRDMLTGSSNAALASFDAAIIANPKFAEAYNKRATLLFTLGRFDESINDINSTLALEPRHYGALAGLGMILERRNDAKGALSAYRRALAIDPFLTNLAERVKQLSLKVEGQPI